MKNESLSQQAKANEKKVTDKKAKTKEKVTETEKTDNIPNDKTSLDTNKENPKTETGDENKKKEQERDVVDGDGNVIKPAQNEISPVDKTEGVRKRGIKVRDRLLKKGARTV